MNAQETQTGAGITDKVIAAYLADRARSQYWKRDRNFIERRAEEARAQPWHVCWWSTNNGKREGYHVKCERDRHLSGAAYACFGKNGQAEAQALCDAHNEEIGLRSQP
jgi:hypothetical protein